MIRHHIMVTLWSEESCRVLSSNLTEVSVTFVTLGSALGQP